MIRSFLQTIHRTLFSPPAGPDPLQLNQVPELVDLTVGPEGGGVPDTTNRKRKFQHSEQDTTKKRRRLAMENIDDEEDVQIIPHETTLDKIINWFKSPAKPKSQAATTSAHNAAASSSAASLPATSKDDLNAKEVEFVKEVKLGGTYQAAPPTKLQTVQPEAEVQLIKVVNPNKVECIDLSKVVQDDQDTPGTSTGRSSSDSSVILDTTDDNEVKYMGRMSATAVPKQRFKVITERERKEQRKNNIPANLKTTMKSSGKRRLVDGIFGQRSKGGDQFNHLKAKQAYDRILNQFSTYTGYGYNRSRQFPSLVQSIQPLNIRVAREAEKIVKNIENDEVDHDISVIKPSASSSAAGSPRLSDAVDRHYFTPGIIRAGSFSATKVSTPASGSKSVSSSLGGAKPVVASTPFINQSAVKDDEVTIVSRSSSLEDEFKSQEVYCQDFLKKMKEKYGANSRDRERKINSEKVKKEFHEKKREEIEEHLNERILENLRITSAVMEEPAYEEEEEEDTTLPDITQEMEQVIRRAYNARGSELLIEEYKIPISGKDVETLKGLNWLNDEIINFYLQMIVARGGTEDKYPKVYAYNTFFYTTYRDNGYSRVRRWTKKTDVFSHDLLLVPVHLGMHWCLATIDVQNKTINYYDSMGGNNQGCLDHLANYIKEEHQDKKKEALDFSGWKTIIRKDIPQQQNGSDCGMFTCKFSEYLSRRAKITFTQQDMPYFRKRMVYEIVKNHLLKP